MQANSRQHKGLVKLGIPRGWIYVTDISFIHTSCMVYIDYRFNLHLIIHARPLVRILGHGCSDRTRTCNPTSIHVVSACGSPLRQDGHTQFLLQSGERREMTVIKRGLLIDLKKKKKKHTLCCKYISKGTARMVSVICTAWFKHAKAMFKPQANTSELWITRCYCLNACTWEPLRFKKKKKKKIKMGI